MSEPTAAECDGLCMTGADVGVPSASIAYAHPGCPKHDPGEPDLTEIAAVETLIAHGRTRIEGCHCGWGMDGNKLAQSHPLHVWRELQRAVLPGHDTALAERIAQAIEAACHCCPVAGAPQCAHRDAAAIARSHKSPPATEAGAA